MNPPTPYKSVATRAYYMAPITQFLGDDESRIVDALVRGSPDGLEKTEERAWREEIRILKASLNAPSREGLVAFEYAVPRIGKRIDVLLVMERVLFVLEFKVGESRFTSDALNQVWDYALDLKNFHSTSHDKIIAPILIATEATTSSPLTLLAHQDGVLQPIRSTVMELPSVIRRVLGDHADAVVDIDQWSKGIYAPTPTIIEAAKALYAGHGVEDISRNDAAALNLNRTADAVTEIVETARRTRSKSICFVTGVPGAGKTLVGLKIAQHQLEQSKNDHSVFLSGNGPLVKVLSEALACDRIRRDKAEGKKTKKGVARRAVSAFIQNVHHFRDEYWMHREAPPIDHVAIFDEAQRAWNKEQTCKFMRTKKGDASFSESEPEFLISCMDRHKDWAVIVCLVGGGQEINTGEAGITEWLHAITTSFPNWNVHLSPKLKDSEYAAGKALESLAERKRVHVDECLHLSVSMRSFRAEHLSSFVKQMLDLDAQLARETLKRIQSRYPVVLTRDLGAAKTWVRSMARANERYGMLVSSEAQRLRPHAIDVRVKLNPVQWFLEPKDDVRSSCFLEEAATQFDVQGLELDWTCVVWDGDFRHSREGWRHWSFRGNKWQRINTRAKQTYLKNAYRVLLTRARQGMVVVVPKGNDEDSTRTPAFYDDTFEYLRNLGLPLLSS